MSVTEKISRRAIIAGVAATAGGALLKKLPGGQATVSAEQGAAPRSLTDPSTAPGAPTSALGARSAFVAPARAPVGVLSGGSYTPLHELTGTMTPNDLVFERHHAGVPAIDPTRYKLLVHGLVDRSMTFTLNDLQKLPSVSRVYFIECSGNGRPAYRDPKPEMTAQNIDGMTSNGEWTGVPLRVLLRETGAKAAATWLFAEGGDAPKVSRSVPIEKAMDDALLVYAFNGEPLRPSNGYPVRLFLPGYEANTCIKWLRRLELVDQPNMSKDETSKYTDPLPNGTARQFSFVMDAKSIITRPSSSERIDRGWREISGIAWSGRGKIVRVDVSVDGGREWSSADLHGPVLPKAHTRFSMMWEWKGDDATLMSRAVDETGYMQPTYAVFASTRGKGTDYHYNYIRSWNVSRDGLVTFGGAQ